MSTRAGTAHLLRRVAARAGIGVWRHRGGVFLAAAASVALGGYLAFSSPGLAPRSLATASVLGSSSDCADTAMAAIADKSPAAAQRAYQCMDPAFQQRVPEQTFLQQMQAQSLPNVNSVDRVGDHRGAAGGMMVYYAVNSNGQSVGYIVYLSQNGKVLKIE